MWLFVSGALVFLANVLILSFSTIFPSFHPPFRSRRDPELDPEPCSRSTRRFCFISSFDNPISPSFIEFETLSFFPRFQNDKLFKPANCEKHTGSKKRRSFQKRRRCR